MRTSVTLSGWDCVSSETERAGVIRASSWPEMNRAENRTAYSVEVAR
ncbi:hypothetical protein [Cystobacter fuscus]